MLQGAIKQIFTQCTEYHINTDNIKSTSFLYNLQKCPLFQNAQMHFTGKQTFSKPRIITHSSGSSFIYSLAELEEDLRYLGVHPLLNISFAGTK